MHFYFIGGIKVLESNNSDQQETNRIVTEISQGTEMTFGVSKCAEVARKRGKTTKGEGLQINNCKVECLGLENVEYYIFFGMEEYDRQ